MVKTLPALTAGTQAMLDALVVQSGWNQTAQDWAIFSRHGSICAVRDAQGRIIASGAVLPMGDTAAWISMILVAPEARGQGLGRRVFEHCLREVQDAHRTAMLDATPAGEHIYSQFAFASLWRLTRWQRDAAPGPVPAPRSDKFSLDTLAALDAEALGFSRRAVLADLLAREGTRVARNPRGFAIVRTGRIAHHIGPLLATDETAAAALLRDIAPSVPGRVFVDVPDARPALRLQLSAAGFTPQRGFVRMALGEQAPTGQTAFIHAVAGPEFG
ncbi:MAG TPA: GNAT family N-acetyltransferase [Burkholderiaceae bacterium]